MLVLTRKLGEKIAIGNEITVVVAEINATHVKIGIEAPREITIYREEILARTILENRAAAGFNLKKLPQKVRLFLKKSKEIGLDAQTQLKESNR